MTKKLPIGLQSFQDFDAFDSIYVDKTSYIYQLINSGGKTFFLSRPRRFGKSLFLSTIQAVFEGRKELFKGLYIEDKIDWDHHAVLMLDMSGLDTFSAHSMKVSLLAKLQNIALKLDLKIDLEEPISFLSRLIFQLFEKTGKYIVVLVDEYDKPILDVIEKPELAEEIREFLQSFYVVLKSSSDIIRFLMLTGVTKVSQASIFSGLNNLYDLTLDPEFAGVCGYTQQELEGNFSGYIDQISKTSVCFREEVLKQIKHWYNGYSWDGINFVYNPFSVLLLFKSGHFDAHWFTTGSSKGLLNLMRKADDFSPIVEEYIYVNRDFANKQALENLDVVPLFFQAGYLTIKAYHADKKKFELQIPNEEVRVALSESIMVDYSGKPNSRVNVLGEAIREAFSAGKTALAIENLDVLLADISYNTYEPNKNESHYHALFQLVMNMTGIDHRAERANNLGRADGILRFSDRIYVVEIKYATSLEGFPVALNKAMDQIKKNGYDKPYLNQGKKVHLLALAFTKGSIAFKEEVIF